MGGIQQHDLQQLGGEAGGEDAALEALLDEHGNAAGMVDMGVGHQHVVDGIGGKGKFGVGYLVPPLLQSAVDEDAFTIDLQAVAAACHALVRAEKAELHRENLLVDFCEIGMSGYFISVYHKWGLRTRAVFSKSVENLGETSQYAGEKNVLSFNGTCGIL